MTAVISQAADDLIVACEVSSRTYYEKTLRHPEWPGGRSGVTIAIGYDLGYATKTKITSDWGGKLPGAMIDAMVPCLGLTGDDARRALPSVRNAIDVPWDQAIDVYEHVDIPEWTDRVCAAVPRADRLPPDCLGALTSLAYNRGASFQMQGDRYREMRAIREHVIAGELDKVPGEFRSMERLWPDMRGLRVRRDKEADLWTHGLAAPIVLAPAKSKPSEAPAPLVKPKSGNVEKGAVGGLVGTATTEAATQASSSGHGTLVVGGIILVGVVIAVGTVAYLHWHNSQPVLARAKG